MKVKSMMNRLIQMVTIGFLMNQIHKTEMKIHYLIVMLQRAGILLDADGNPVKQDLPDAIQEDSNEVQNSIRGNW